MLKISTEKKKLKEFSVYFLLKKKDEKTFLFFLNIAYKYSDVTL